MEPSFATIRACVALFYSGIFWMMVLFVIENRRVESSERRPLLPVAVLLMVGSVYLMLGIVAHQDLSATLLDQASLTSAGMETGR